MTPTTAAADAEGATKLSVNSDTCAGTSCLFLAYYLFILSDIPSFLVFRVDKGERLSLIYSAWRAVQASFSGILTGPAPDPYQPAAVDKPLALRKMERGIPALDAAVRELRFQSRSRTSKTPATGAWFLGLPQCAQGHEIPVRTAGPADR